MSTKDLQFETDNVDDSNHKIPKMIDIGKAQTYNTKIVFFSILRFAFLREKKKQSPAHRFFCQGATKEYVIRKEREKKNE